MTLKPVSELFWERNPFDVAGEVDMYAACFQDFPYQATQVIGKGSESYAIELDGGRVLKVNRREMIEDQGERDFDADVIDEGAFMVEDIPSDRPEIGGNVFWQIQEPLDMNVSEEEEREFARYVSGLGYVMNDRHFGQVGRAADGTIKLVDPFAVRLAKEQLVVA